MNRLIFILAFVLAAVTCAAQVNVSGVVVKEGSNELLTGASVILRNAEGKIKKYATSDASGRNTELSRYIGVSLPGVPNLSLSCG